MRKIFKNFTNISADEQQNFLHATNTIKTKLTRDLGRIDSEKKIKISCYRTVHLNNNYRNIILFYRVAGPPKLTDISYIYGQE